MPAETRTITFGSFKPNGDPWVRTWIFLLYPGSYDSSAHYPSARVTARPESDGYGTVELWPNEGGSTVSHYEVTKPSRETARFTVPTSPGPFTLEDLEEAGVTTADPQFPTIMSFFPYMISAKAAGAKGDGATDDTDDLEAADALVVAAGGGILGFPEGDYHVDDDMEFSEETGLFLPPGATLSPASTKIITINGPYIQSGRKSLDLSRGGIVKFGKKAGAELDASYFGALPGLGEAEATAVAVAFNDLFDTLRASTTSTTPRVTAVKIRAGQYHVDDSTFAGFSSAQHQRYYQLDARNVEIVATEGCAGKPVWDLTGIQGGTTRYDGLRITTLAGMVYADLPSVGIFQARFVTPSLSVPSSGRGLFIGTEAAGYFQLAAWLNFSSEDCSYIACWFENYEEQGKWGFVNQSFPYYDDGDGAVSPIKQASPYQALSITPAIGYGQHSNGTNMFQHCRANTAWEGTAADGGGMLFVNPKRLVVSGGFINPDSEAVRAPAIRIVNQSPGTRPLGLVLRDVKCHRNWDTLVEIVGIVSDLTMENFIGRVRRSWVKLTTGSQALSLRVMQRSESTLSTSGVILTADLAANSFSLTADAGLPEEDKVGHGFVDDDVVYWGNGTAPTPFVLATLYYVVNADFDDFQLAATLGGAAIDVTVDGDATLNANWTIRGVDASGVGCSIAQADITMGLLVECAGPFNGIIRAPDTAVPVLAATGTFAEVLHLDATSPSHEFRNVNVRVTGDALLYGDQQGTITDPGDVAGLIRWGEVNGLGLANNDPIASYTDLSGLAKHYVAAGAARPTFKTAIFTGSKAGALFATDDVMRCDALAAYLTGTDVAFTLYLVVKKVSNSTTQCLWSATKAATTAASHDLSTTTTVYNPRRIDDALLTKSRSGGTPNTSTHIIVMMFNGQRVSVYDSNTLLFSGTLDVAAATLDAVALGGLPRAGTTTRFAEMYIGADLLYTGVHSDDQREALVTYLTPWL